MLNLWLLEKTRTSAANFIGSLYKLILMKCLPAVQDEISSKIPFFFFSGSVELYPMYSLLFTFGAYQQVHLHCWCMYSLISIQWLPVFNQFQVLRLIYLWYLRTKTGTKYFFLYFLDAFCFECFYFMVIRLWWVQTNLTSLEFLFLCSNCDKLIVMWCDWHVSEQSAEAPWMCIALLKRICLPQADMQWLHSFTAGNKCAYSLSDIRVISLHLTLTQSRW